MTVNADPLEHIYILYLYIKCCIAKIDKRMDFPSKTEAYFALLPLKVILK